VKAQMEQTELLAQLMAQSQGQIAQALEHIAASQEQVAMAVAAPRQVSVQKDASGRVVGGVSAPVLN
jgi:hypothetical protein